MRTIHEFEKSDLKFSVSNTKEDGQRIHISGELFEIRLNKEQAVALKNKLGVIIDGLE